MATFQYILDGHEPVPASDGAAWASWMFGDGSADRRRVCWDVIGDVRVSTVFTGCNLSAWLDEPPQLFETMIFRPNGHNETFGRWTSWAQAEEMHASAVRAVRKEQPP